MLFTENPQVKTCVKTVQIFKPPTNHVRERKHLISRNSGLYIGHSGGAAFLKLLKKKKNWGRINLQNSRSSKLDHTAPELKVFL